jgi:uroporphyrinogen-III synthase
MGRPRVLITRAAHQASALAEELCGLGAEPVFLPTIELAEPSSFAPLDEAITGLSGFDWLIFTSANAVEVFVGRGGAAREGLKVAAIGAVTAGALDVAGFRADLVPGVATAEGLVEALQGVLNVRGGRFLLVRAEVGREVLPEALREAGAEVTVVAAYRTVVPAASVAGIQELFGEKGSWPDAITFTSSSTATNLLALLEVAGVRLPDEVLRVSIGPVTSQTLGDAGYPPHAEAVVSTVHGLAVAVVEAVAEKGRASSSSEVS